jgi:hypothetical protein
MRGTLAVVKEAFMYAFLLYPCAWLAAWYLRKKYGVTAAPRRF